MLGFAAALLSMFSFGASTILIKRPIEKIGVDSSIMLRYVFSSVLTFSIAVASGGLVLPSAGTLGLIAFAAFVGGVGIFFFFRAVGRGLLSVVDPLARTYTVLTVLIAIALFGEVLSTWDIAGGALLVLSAVVLALNRKNSGSLESGAGYALVTVAGWGVFFAVLKPIIAEVGAVSTAFYTEFGVLVFLALTLRPSRIRLDDRGSALGLFASAAAVAMGSVAYNLAIASIGVASTSLITAGTPAVVVLLSWVIFGERIRPHKYLALAGIAAGLALVGA